jgi:hypothetical protein
MVKNRKNTVKARSASGAMVNIPTCPPSFVSRPWYNLTLRVRATAIINNSDVALAISEQLGINPFLVDVRLNYVRVWSAFAATVPVQMSLIVYDPTRALALSLSGGAVNGPILEEITRFPDVVNRAAVGYKYPERVRQMAISTNALYPVVLFRLSGGGGNSVMYIDLQWRPGVNTPQQASFMEVDELVPSGGCCC